MRGRPNDRGLSPTSVFSFTRARYFLSLAARQVIEQVRSFVIDTIGCGIAALER